MNELTLSLHDILEKQNSGLSIGSCRAGEPLNIIINLAGETKIQFIDDLGEPLSGNPLNIGVTFGGGEEELLATDTEGILTLTSDTNAGPVTLKIPEETVDQLRSLVAPLWSDEQHCKKRDESLVKKDAGTAAVCLNERLSALEIRIPETSSYRISIQPYSLATRMFGMYFDKNRCFMLPSAIRSLKNIVTLYNEHRESILLIVGHTDATGEADYNSTLSLERAAAVKAYLTDDVDAWLEWYGTDKKSSKRWGDQEDSAMIDALLAEAGTSEGGSKITRFQKWNNERLDTAGSTEEQLAVDGSMGPHTRRALIKRYMEQDGTTLPDDIVPVIYGCGEFFPLDAEETAETPKQDGEKKTDRRVELFFFDKKLGIHPAPQGELSTADSTCYPAWRKQADEVDFSTESKNALHVFCRMSEQTAVPQGTPYRITLGTIIRTGIIDNSEGKIIETGLELSDKTELLVEWGKA